MLCIFHSKKKYIRLIFGILWRYFRVVNIVSPKLVAFSPLSLATLFTTPSIEGAPRSISRNRQRRTLSTDTWIFSANVALQRNPGTRQGRYPFLPCSITILGKWVTTRLSTASPFFYGHCDQKKTRDSSGMRPPFSRITIVEKIELHTCNCKYGVRNRPIRNSVQLGAFRGGLLQTPYLLCQILHTKNFAGKSLFRWNHNRKVQISNTRCDFSKIGWFLQVIEKIATVNW